MVSPPLRSAFEPSHNQQWSVAHGRSRARHALVHAWEFEGARDNVLDQRIRDVLTLPTRNVSDVASPAGRGPPSWTGRARHGSRTLRRNSDGHHLREVRAGGMGYHRGHGCGGVWVLPDQKAL